MAKDDISPAGNALTDIERQDSVHMAKATNNAKSAADAEHKMTLLQGIRTYPKAIAWSVLISTCIAMEGYDISLVNNFYAFPQFTKKYGELTPDGSYQVPAAVRRTSRYSVFILSPTPHSLLMGSSMVFLSDIRGMLLISISHIVASRPQQRRLLRRNNWPPYQRMGFGAIRVPLYDYDFPSPNHRIHGNLFHGTQHSNLACGGNPRRSSMGHFSNPHGDLCF